MRPGLLGELNHSVTKRGDDIKSGCWFRLSRTRRTRWRPVGEVAVFGTNPTFSMSIVCRLLREAGQIFIGPVLR